MSPNMQHNPIETMHREHEIIAQMEDIIQNLFHSWIKQPEEYTNSVNNILHFIKEYSDGFHHQKEEQILFPALRNCPEFTLDEILDELESHHERFRDLSHKIESDLTKKDYPESYALLKEYMNDLLDHIAVENDELFVLTENILSEDELEKIYFLFEDLDREMGLDKKLKLESLVLNSDINTSKEQV